ncbi:unnamed protein product [Camellia sinensis]
MARPNKHPIRNGNGMGLGWRLHSSSQSPNVKNSPQREEQRSTITTTTEMTGDLLQQQRSTTTTTTANLIGEITRDEPDSGNEEIGKGEFGVGGVFFTASHQSEIGGDGKRERRTMGLSFEGGSVEGLED